MNTSPLEYHKSEFEAALEPSSVVRILPETGGAESILDIGCGAGQTLFALGRGKRRIGVDIDVAALQFGRKYTGDSELHLAAAGGENLPFAGNSFDFVYSRVALPYMNVPTVLNEIRRVLRPKGRLWLTLHPIDIPIAQFRRGNVKGKIYAVYIILNGVWMHLSGRTQPFVQGKCESFQTERGMRIALSRAGFVNTTFRRTEHHFVVTADAP